MGEFVEKIINLTKVMDNGPILFISLILMVVYIYTEAPILFIHKNEYKPHMM